ncbi:MCE family protein [Actinomadura barringtoniae]|uniref:MCE family protein n=1 Tax=Actinomadura barringtoniae TaxID=1427535 RepID=A0A939T7A8_9ACTN|nr:MCE family protein [Actinomadura barringtoniae]MBO2455886.1 MCE family protein [Actinomadura barringtoniae]
MARVKSPATSPRVLRAAVVGTVAAVTLAGCSFGGIRGVQDIPLPGGADVGDHPYKVTVQFGSVLNLVPQAAVKVNDVAVGRVEKVSLPRGGWTAEATLLINGDVKLPANAYAQLRQSNLLGEKYIALTAPTGTPATGRLTGGSVIPVTRTNRNPEIEEVFGALSLLLNGGGLNQIQTITKEFNHALNGNEPQVRSLLEQVSKLTSTLDGNRQGITDALDGLNRLSATLNGRRGQINTVLDDLEPGLKVLERQRGALVGMLEALDRLSGVAVTTINKSKDDMVADLQTLEPTLRKLGDSGKDLPQSLQVLLTYPFTDAVMPAIKGDYLNVYLEITAARGTGQIIPSIPEGGSGSPSPSPSPSASKTQANAAGDGPPLPLPASDGGAGAQGGQN